MKLSIKLVIAALLLTFAFSSCKKYPDGPSMSLRSKEHRAEGEYMIEKYTLNGADQTDLLKTAGGPDYAFHLEEDGSYHVHGNLEDEGKWKFSSDKKNLLTTSNTAGSTEQTFQILMLKNKRCG